MNKWKMLIILAVSAYIHLACYIFYHSMNHSHYLNENCATCTEIFYIVKAVDKVVRFFYQYSFSVLYLSILCIYSIRIVNTILNINPISLKVKLTN